MSDVKIVDARGLSCPQPVMLTMQALKKVKEGTVEVLVDSNIALENVSRLAVNSGWKTAVERQTENNIRIVLKK
jgi:tRNA 2-thiouridine synthesizing protein A